MTKLFDTGKQFPPIDSIERLSKYYRGKKIFDGKTWDIYERASEILKNTPYASQLKTLYIAVNIMDVLLTKPADLMVGDPPSFESGLPDNSAEQKALNRIIEENDLTQTTHELVIGSGIRGDAFVKTYYAKRADFSAIPEGYEIPDTKPEPIIESVDAAYVFPELSRGTRKKFKAVNVAWVEWVEERNGLITGILEKSKITEIPYLNVERHVPGYIIYERYRLHPNGIVTEYGAEISTYSIGERVSTLREDGDVVSTGVPQILVHHIPYKSVDYTWEGVSGIEKLESILAAINDRLVQIDYILWKHSDPTAYGPELEMITDNDTGQPKVAIGGKYIPVTKGDQTPGYMTWNSQLEGAFRQLDVLIGLIFQMSETPQWLFGTTLIEDKGGTGTSHTDAAAIKARFMPILSKVKRIRVHVDKALRDALWTAMQLELYANSDIPDFERYEPVYPKINWKDGIPRDDKTEAEVMSIRTGGKSTLDVMSAIKHLDDVDDDKATEIMARIRKNEEDATIMPNPDDIGIA